MQVIEIHSVTAGSDRQTWFVRADGTLCVSLELKSDEGEELLEEL